MSGARLAKVRPSKLPAGHIHLPSVHIRGESGAGFDYEEDYYVTDRGRRVERVVRFAAIERGCVTLLRETVDELCEEELTVLRGSLPDLMDEGNPEAQAAMEHCARKEFARQQRIAAGQETACVGCGCSESRACSGGCIWATPNRCSRCARAQQALRAGG